MKNQIILTGGAGFIGSAYLGKLNGEGIDNVTLVDDLKSNPDKKKNLDGKRFTEYIEKDKFITLLGKNKLSKPGYIIHMGACSSTTLKDEDYYKRNNCDYSVTLANWAFKNKTPFMYASSGATYGNGSMGYDDSNEATYKLKPLNLYGKYKQLFDLWILKNGFEKSATGIKFFNVFGPNEYHKGEMKSVICKKFKVAKEKGIITLFKSNTPDYKDGEQKRDFVYIKDTIDIMHWFFNNPDITGIYNLGTGKARSWNDTAHAMFAALGKTGKIEYIDMPDYLEKQYQNFTEARMDKLRRAGCKHEFLSLEDSVKDYTTYLSEGKYI